MESRVKWLTSGNTLQVLKLVKTGPYRTRLAMDISTGCICRVILWKILGVEEQVNPFKKLGKKAYIMVLA